MNHNDRSIRQILDEPTLADLVNGDPLGLCDRLQMGEAMTASRSGKWEPKKKIGTNSKPIGKKHYRKSISHLRGLAHNPIDDTDSFGNPINSIHND